MPRSTPPTPTRLSPGSDAWRRASELGVSTLDALERDGASLPLRDARALAIFCSRRRLIESFAWAASRMAEPGRAAARLAWRLAADLAEALLTPNQDGRLDDLLAAGRVLFTAYGPPPAALLHTQASRGDFASLSILLPWIPLDARLAQTLADARPETASVSLRARSAFRSLAWEARVEVAFRAGAFLAPFAPHMDLARDARTLDPSCCAFSLGAGAHFKLASNPPLATLCHEAARRHATTSKGWPLLAAINALQAHLGPPPEVLCARLLLEAGCSPSEHLPGGASALNSCARALRAAARARGSPLSRARLARAMPLARWMAGASSPLSVDHDTPLGALESLVRAASERAVLELLDCAPAGRALSNRL